MMQEEATTTTTPTPTESFRKAQQDLFAEQRPRRQRPGASSTAAATASEAAAIQQSLGRTQKLLQTELKRVATVHNAIREDDTVLQQTMDTHKTMNVDKAASALTQLERAQQKERRVLAASVAFFWCAVFYVAWCRILIKIPFVDRITLLIPMVLDGVRYGFEIIQDKVTELLDLD